MFNQFQGCRQEFTHRSRLFLGIMACVASFSSWAKYTELFSEHKISVPFNVTQAVMAENILPNQGVELIVVGVDDNRQRKLGIYGIDLKQGDYIRLDMIDIPNDFFGFDLGEENAEGLKALYFLTKAEIKKYIPAHMEHESSLSFEQKVSSMYLSDKADIFRHINFVLDINDDGKDDFFLPHFEQLNLWLSDCCSQRHGQSLPISAAMQLKHSQFRFNDVDLYFQDMNQDHRTDIVYAKQGRVIVHLQNQNMQFATVAKYIDILPAISAQEWWNITDENGQELDQSQLTHRKMDAIRDINGDDIPDLVVKYTNSAGVLDKTIDYEFYYGRYKEGELIYQQQPSTKVTSKDTLSDIYFIDLEDDGKVEVLVSSFDIGISQIIGALMSGSIDQDTMIFAMDEQGLFTEKPMVNQEVELTFSLSSGTTGEPLVKVLDVNGDEHKDLVYSEGTDLIRVLFATPDDKRPFSSRSVRQKMPIPKSALDVLVHDVNDDGKDDLIFHFGPADGPEKMRELSILLANP